MIALRSHAPVSKTCSPMPIQNRQVPMMAKAVNRARWLVGLVRVISGTDISRSRFRSPDALRPVASTVSVHWPGHHT